MTRSALCHASVICLIRATCVIRATSLVRVASVCALGAGSLVGLAGCGASQTDLSSQVGAVAPDLTATDQAGATHHLTEARGHTLIVYFYPKDGTPGCTKEACAFRDTWDQFKTAGIQVFGVSSDDQKSHEQFAKEQKLPFPILADPTHAWAEAFHVPTRLGMDKRVTFLIDANGKIAKVYPNVDPAIHAGELLRDAATLPGATPPSLPPG